jgi:hypothetical protein
VSGENDERIATLSQIPRLRGVLAAPLFIVDDKQPDMRVIKNAPSPKTMSISSSGTPMVSGYTNESSVPYHMAAIIRAYKSILEVKEYQSCRQSLLGQHETYRQRNCMHRKSHASGTIAIQSSPVDKVSSLQPKS